MQPSQNLHFKFEFLYTKWYPEKKKSKEKIQQKNIPGKISKGKDPKKKSKEKNPIGKNQRKKIQKSNYFGSPLSRKL